MRKAIVILFNLLFFFVPLIFYAKTSEVFEFNKMVMTYTFTAVIVGFWMIRMVNSKKFIFRRTIIDIPLLIFFASQLISTFVSIDIHSSIFGYYSRFNGGILSTISYMLLYWSYVSNFTWTETKKLLKVSLISGLIVSIYGILEHFGGSISCLLLVGKLTDDCWVQDVRTRVFATLGQPNWMAAYLTALIPLTWAFVLETWKDKNKYLKFFWALTGAIFFWAILYTRSRSGLFGLGISGIIFAAWAILNSIKSTRKNLNQLIVPGILIGSIIAVAVIFSGTPWTPSASDFLNKKSVSQLATELNKTSEGGTESGDIRKIVWTGAINIWKAYPVFGTGPETFAFTYYMYRPKEHNLVSEWDFLYNKAHNEYLNFAANSGTVGLVSYLAVVGFSIFAIYKLSKSKAKDKESLSDLYLIIALACGYISILITNFFGFSVVITQLILFMTPAMALSLNSVIDDKNNNVLTNGQKITNGLIILVILYFVVAIFRYWSADALYAQAKAEIELGRIQESVSDLGSAIKKEPNEPLYHDKLAQVYAAVAKASIEEKDATSAAELAKTAVSESDTAISLAPKNFIVLQDHVNIYTDLSAVDPNYILETVKTLEYLTHYSPTYAKTYYKLGIAYQIIGQREQAIVSFEKAIELKPDYGDAINALKNIRNQKPQ